MNWIEKTLSDKGEPSSKRQVGILAFLYVLIMQPIGVIDMDMVYTLLTFAGVALGISGLEKLRK